MGFGQNAANRVREFFAREPEKQAVKVIKGPEYQDRPQMGYGNLLDAYGYSELAKFLEISQGLMERFIDYENMEDYPEIATGYDIYADDATQPDLLKKQTIWITAKDQNIEKMLNDLLHKKLRIEDDIWPLARTLAKYGNVYGENLVTNEGVIGINFLPVPTVRRIQDRRGVLLGFVQDTSGNFEVGVEDFATLLTRSQAGQSASTVRGGGEMTAYEDWEVTHWRLASKHLRSLYGFGISEPARWIWKRLMLLEDALLIYKLTRAPSRYAFYVDTGGLDQQRALAYVDQVAQRLKRKKFINPSTGRPDLRYNPLAYDEDFFIPTRDGRDSTRIDVLSGPDFQSVEDVEYFQNKLFAALKIPKMYLGKMEDAAKAVLSQEDVQFARTIMRVQREIGNGIRKTCRVHMAALGIAPSSIEYEVMMSTPSTIFDLARMEVWSARADLADRLKETVPVDWILRRIFQFSEDETIELMQKKDAEKIHELEVEAQGSVAAEKISQAAEKPEEAMELMRTRSVSRSRDIMTEGKDVEHYRKLDAKLTKLLSESGKTRQKLAQTNLFLQEVRYGLKNRRAA